MILKPEKSPDVMFSDLEFGKNGQPFYISGPNDRVPAILEKLRKAFGEGNFGYLSNVNEFGSNNFTMMNFDDDDFDDDDDDDDDDYDDDNDIQEAEYEEIKP
ncbi:MAG: hypothetical protein HC817_14090 [Saprospiraceae bacterium]|nr:hypothetical protein [Saprospiraceae bacterium]